MKGTEGTIRSPADPFRPALCVAAILCGIFSPGQSAATWSAAAVDAESRQVGAAGASCALDAWSTAGVVPGRGVIVAQARISAVARDKGMSILRAGAGPDEALAALTDPEFDPSVSMRQYGIAALAHSAAARAFTGGDTMEFRGDRQREYVTVQGNSLAAAGVIDSALEAFGESPGNDDFSLPERLLSALEAGSRAGGDRRCGKQTALSAFLVVSRPADDGGTPFLSLRVRSPVDPVAKLRERYEAWKRQAGLATHTVDEILRRPQDGERVILAGVMRAESFPGVIVFNDGTGEVAVHFDDLAGSDDDVLPAGLDGDGGRFLLYGQVGRYGDGRLHVLFEKIKVIDQKDPPLPAPHGGP